MTETLHSYYIMDARGVTAKRIDSDVFEFLYDNGYLVIHRSINLNDRIQHNYYNIRRS